MVKLLTIDGNGAKAQGGRANINCISAMEMR